MTANPVSRAKAARNRHRRRMIAYGTWEPWLDAGPVREHVRSLQAAGMGAKRLSELTGVSQSAIKYLLCGHPHDGRPPAAKISADLGSRLLAVTPDLEVLPVRARVDATGTRRRLQALVATGWPVSVLAERLGACHGYLNQVLRGLRRQVGARMARRVAALHRDLWHTSPPAVTARQRAQVTRARNRAAASGWVTGLAWEDGDGPHGIDNPDAVPLGAVACGQQGEAAA